MNVVFRFSRFPVSSAFQSACRNLKTSSVVCGLKDWGDSTPPPDFGPDDTFDPPPRRHRNRFEDQKPDDFDEPPRREEDRFGGQMRQNRNEGQMGRHDERFGNRGQQRNQRRFGICKFIYIY